MYMRNFYNEIFLSIIQFTIIMFETLDIGKENEREIDENLSIYIE